MSLKEDIKNKAKEIRYSNFSKKPTNSVPNITTSSLTFGCNGLTFPANVLYIDMRGSTKVLNIHQRRVVAKIHMIYYYAICRIAKYDGGEIRSFNGDSLLVFFYGNGVDITKKAVISAMKMHYAITQIVNDTLSAYTDIDFGIGIDYGEILATKVGLGGSEDNKDLIWIGNAVNRATKISDECRSPHHIGISDTVYSRLDETMIGHKEKNQWGLIIEKKYWNRCCFDYNNKNEYMFKTSYYYEIM